MLQPTEHPSVKFTGNNNSIAGPVVKNANVWSCRSVVLVHGSGSAAWDNNLSYVGKHIAASRGFAVLSCDKLGTGSLTGD